MEKCDIILLSCRFNSWCVPPFLHLFKKFWGDNVILVAEQDYSTTVRCSFLQLPNNLIRKGECPRDKFSDSLIYAMEHTPNKNTIIMLADYFIDKQVDITLLGKSVEYMCNTPNILRIDIGNISKPNPYIQLTDWLFECQTRDCFYPASLCPGLWNKELYLKLICPGLDPWATEHYAYLGYLNNSKLRSLWSEPAINYINVMRGRDDANIVFPPHLHEEVKSFIPLRFKYDDK